MLVSKEPQEHKISQRINCRKKYIMNKKKKTLNASYEIEKTTTTTAAE